MPVGPGRRVPEGRELRRPGPLSATRSVCRSDLTLGDFWMDWEERNRSATGGCSWCGKFCALQKGNHFTRTDPPPQALD